MSDLFEKINQDLLKITNEWKDSGFLKENDIFVVGCSTSEITGKQIGTSGSEKAAAILFKHLHQLSIDTNSHLAFQGCEHINRAIVMNKSVADKNGFEIVSVVPAKNAGGSMATHAFHHLDNPVVVEEIKADIGMDIGNTLIGMHLKKVAVPIRFTQKTIGEAAVTFARTRPKLIGGARAVYQ